MFFIQTKQSKIYVNDINDSNYFDENDNFDENSSEHIVIQAFRAARRREQRIQQKARRQIKKLKIIKFMHIDVVIEKHRINALINSNNEINIISQRYVKQIEIQFDMSEFITLFIINDRRVNIHDIHFLNLKIDDRQSHIRYFDEFFLISDINHEEVMLNMS